MKSFKQWLIEAMMDLPTALSIFGLAQPPQSEEELKTLYKKLAMQNHPDRGGSTQKMQELNAAKDYLKKNVGRSYFTQGKASTKKTGTSRASSTVFDPKKRKEENEKRYQIILKEMKKFFSGFDKAAYQKYFESIFGVKFDAEISILDKSNSAVYGPMLKAVFSTKDRETVFTLKLQTKMMAAEDALMRGTNLGGNGRTFEYFVDTSAFTNGKAQVVVKGWLRSNSDTSVLTAPDTVFPLARMKKLASGNVRKNSSLKKRDFEALFKDKYSATYNRRNGCWYIDFAKDKDGNILCIPVKRYKVPGEAFYFFASLFSKRSADRGHLLGDIKMTPVHTSFMPENKETYEFLKSAFDYARKVKNIDAAAAFINAGVDKIRAAYKKSKGWV